MMHKKCDCQPQNPKKNEIPNPKITHIINLLRNHYISPYKIMYMLDPKQADYFKSRNQSSGCCSSNHITIKNQQLTKIQKYLKEIISYSSLLFDLNKFLENCLERYVKIKQSGEKDKLEVTSQVQKFLIDKVMAESINNHLYAKLSMKIKEESMNNNKQIGLWATPATWYQRYPTKKLQNLQGKFISELINKQWSIITKYVNNQRQIFRQLTILEKDGKFQQSKSIKNLKILNNIEKYIEIKTSNDGYLFQQTRELIIKISSIPFQLNAKANLFCTVSPNLQVIYSKKTMNILPTKGDFKFTMIVNIGGEIKIILNQEEIVLPNESMLIFDNNTIKYSIKSQEKPIFLLINFLGCVQKK